MTSLHKTSVFSCQYFFVSAGHKLLSFGMPNTVANDNCPIPEFQVFEDTLLWNHEVLTFQELLRDREEKIYENNRTNLKQ